MNDPTASGMYSNRQTKSYGNDKNQYKAIRGMDNMYRNENLGPIYSTSMDKQELRSEGEIAFDKYDSNYDQDEFEEQDDDDDDFALPKNHEQNIRQSDKPS